MSTQKAILIFLIHPSDSKVVEEWTARVLGSHLNLWKLVVEKVYFRHGGRGLEININIARDFHEKIWTDVAKAISLVENVSRTVIIDQSNLREKIKVYHCEKATASQVRWECEQWVSQVTGRIKQNMQDCLCDLSVEKSVRGKDTDDATVT